ncbi:MAG: thioredoxin TrxC [Halopseudomonas sp.]|uniref:thioredoxin TrxC n=1 Tax=Halopseudomonas sp. TaxID=2901191 RepID=UPI0030039820
MLITCPHCHRKNRLEAARLNAAPNCGACKQALFTGLPLALDNGNFARHADSDLPLVVDFWAAWCGPCRQFAPVFEQAASKLEPRTRLAKVDTEAAPELAARFAIRSIPTLLIVHQGKEIARLNGALPAAEFMRWLQTNLPAVPA